MLLLKLVVIMVNKCAASECRTSYENFPKSQLATFLFSLKKIELLVNSGWVKFVNCKYWKPALLKKTSVLC